MKLSTRPRSEAVLGLEPETSYMNVQMGSCDPRSRKNTETWMQIVLAPRCVLASAGLAIVSKFIQSLAHTKIGSCDPV